MHSYLFFFIDTATTEIYTLSLHDALPISASSSVLVKSTSTRPPALRSTPSSSRCSSGAPEWRSMVASTGALARSEEHTSELQSRGHLVCRLLLEKKNKQSSKNTY